MSKALEALKDSRRFRHEKEEHLVLIDIDYFNRCLDVIEKELKRLKRRDNINEQLYKDEEAVLKKLKALEIIRSKSVDIKYFRLCKYCHDYNFALDVEELTDEEFELLEEVLL